MQVLKGNPAFDEPRERIKAYLSRGDLHFSADIHISFVCGAAQDPLPDTVERSLRALFLEHVQAADDPKLLCIRAETATTELLRQLEERSGASLSHLEKIIAEIADSVLIFPESPGSFAELGYFSAHEEIAEKTLVVMKVDHQTNSFINLGPIHFIARTSRYGVPFALDSNPAALMPRIVERLLGESLNKRPYRKRFTPGTWKDYSGKSQLAILDEIADVTGALTEPDLLRIIEDSFGAYDVSRVRIMLSLLVAAGRIRRNEDGDIFSIPRDRPFIECDGGERIKVVAKWQAAYTAHFPDVAAQLAAGRL